MRSVVGGGSGRTLSSLLLLGLFTINCPLPPITHAKDQDRLKLLHGDKISHQLISACFCFLSLPIIIPLGYFGNEVIQSLVFNSFRIKCSFPQTNGCRLFIVQINIISVEPTLKLGHIVNCFYLHLALVNYTS